MPKLRWVMSYWLCSEFYMLSSSAQKVWKSVQIWQSYREFKGGPFFETQCIMRTGTRKTISSAAFYSLLEIHCSSERRPIRTHESNKKWLCEHFIWETTSAESLLFGSLCIWAAARRVGRRCCAPTCGRLALKCARVLWMSPSKLIVHAMLTTVYSCVQITHGYRHCVLYDTMRCWLKSRPKPKKLQATGTSCCRVVLVRFGAFDNVSVTEWHKQQLDCHNNGVRLE